MKMTARGEDADGLQGETSLMVAISEEELLDGRATGSARFSGGDDVALAFTVENQNKGLVSAQMTAHGEGDDALLLGETTLEVTLAEEKAVDATAHASARWEDDWVLKLSLANDNAAIFAIDGTLDGKVELGSLSGDGAGTLVFTLGDEKALDLAYDGSVSTDPAQLSVSLSNGGDNIVGLAASGNWGERDGGGFDSDGLFVPSGPESSPSSDESSPPSEEMLNARPPLVLLSVEFCGACQSRGSSPKYVSSLAVIVNNSTGLPSSDVVSVSLLK